MCPTPPCRPGTEKVCYPDPITSTTTTGPKPPGQASAACSTARLTRLKGSRPMPLPRPFASTLVLLGLALAALPGRLAGQAQATTGVIRGTVTDSAGGTLSGASVTLRNAETNAERVLTTNERGVYVATLLRVGTYDVTARALGFQEKKRTG